ncbi:MAG: hypothetical protein DMG19_17725, partial [Acidobacteria bacterium]
MNLAHLHLILNHIPIIGTIIGLGLFIVSLVGNTDDLKRASLMVFAGVALLALPTFFSGVGAQGAIRKDAAVGALALVGLWRRDRLFTGKPWSSNLAVILCFSIVTAGLMARVGATGGDIRHPEIRLAQEVTKESGVSGIVSIFEPSPGKFT